MGAIQFSVVKDLEGFRALRPDWEALSAASDGIRIFQSFDWCWQAWDCVASKCGRRLRIIVGRESGRVVVILPLIAAGIFIRVLGSELFEYHDVLAAPGPERCSWIRAALDQAKKLGASVLLLREARQDGDLASYFERNRIGARSRVIGKTSILGLDAFADWPAYFETLPKQLKSDQRRQWKRLAELPEPGRFEIVEDDAERDKLLQWLHAEKVKWLDANKGAQGGGMYGSDTYRDFLFTTMRRLAVHGQVMTCRIASGTETLAGLVGFVHGDYFVFFMFAYDPRWSGYSPGRLVMAKAIEWCFERKIRTFDMLLGDENYKAVWSTHTVPMLDYFVPLGLEGRFIEKWHDCGASAIFARPWFDAVSKFFPARIRRIIGARLAAQRDLIVEMRRL